MRRLKELARATRAHILAIRRDVLGEPLNRGSRIHLLSNYVRWHVGYKHRGKRWLVSFDNGLHSWVYPFPDHDAGEINIWTLNVDYHDTQLVRRVLTKGDFIVDAGCSIGNRTWPLADLISGALMVDAGDAAIARCRENLRLNRLDESAYCLVNEALGEREGTVFFTDLGGASTINRVATEAESLGKGRQIRMTTIDQELERLGRQAAFIKVDVEGQDLAALKGATRALKSGSVKLVKFEHNQSEPLAPLIAFFDSLGWSVFALDDQGRPTMDSRRIERNMNLFGCSGDQFSRIQSSA